MVLRKAHKILCWKSRLKPSLPLLQVLSCLHEVISSLPLPPFFESHSLPVIICGCMALPKVCDSSSTAIPLKFFSATKAVQHRDCRVEDIDRRGGSARHFLLVGNGYVSPYLHFPCVDRELRWDCCRDLLITGRVVGSKNKG